MRARYYEGTRSRRPGGQQVEVHEEEPGSVRPLEPRLDLWNHSPDGFEWGYGGSGPAQLALALLADALEDDRLAVRLHQAFKRDRIATIDADTWTLGAAEIRAWARVQEQKIVEFPT